MSEFSTLLLIVFFLIFHKRNSDKKFWVIFLYVVLSFISDLLSHFFTLDKFYFFSFFTLIEYTICSYFFYLTFREKSFRRIVLLCSPVFYGLFVYSVIYNYKADLDFDYLSSSFEAILLIIFSILFFYEQLNNPEIYFVYASKTFWIIVGILIYMSSTLFLFISTTVTSTGSLQKNPIWLINNVANVIKNVLFAIAFIKHIVLAIDSSSDRVNKLEMDS